MGIESAILSYVGAKEQSSGAEKAAQTATNLEKEIYYQNREDLAPWLKAGERSLTDLEKETDVLKNLIQNPESYTKSPGYDWLVQQGVNALDRSATAKGKLDSTEHDKNIVEFGQGLAKQNYQNALSNQALLLNRLAGTAGIGQTALGTQTALGQNYANQVSNALSEGILNQTNARTGLYSNLSKINSNALENYAFYSNLNKGYGGGYGGFGGGGYGGASPTAFSGYGAGGSYNMSGYGVT